MWKRTDISDRVGVGVFFIEENVSEKPRDIRHVYKKSIIIYVFILIFNNITLCESEYITQVP